MFRLTTRYLVDHWQGRQGLAWSVLVNLILLRVVITLAQLRLSPPENADYGGSAVPVYLLALMAHGVIFVWQIVGVLRAAERHVRQRGGMAGMWGAQLCAIIAFSFAAMDAFHAWQMTLPVPAQENFAARMDREHASRYTISDSQDGETISIRGTIELGISRLFARKLRANSNIRLVVLESDGGNVYEARGLSKLIRENRIDTRIESRCSSACATVFIAGRHRSIARNARLGFHQYRFDADYGIPLANPEAEQERDRQLYAASGVAVWFQERMFATGPDQIWFPSSRELLDSGVIHAISP